MTVTELIFNETPKPHFI